MYSRHSHPRSPYHTFTFRFCIIKCLISHRIYNINTPFFYIPLNFCCLTKFAYMPFLAIRS